MVKNIRKYIVLILLFLGLKNIGLEANPAKMVIAFDFDDVLAILNTGMY